MSENGSEEDESMLVSWKKVLVKQELFKCVELLRNMSNTRVISFQARFLKHGRKNKKKIFSDTFSKNCFTFSY